MKRKTKATKPEEIGNVRNAEEVEPAEPVYSVNEGSVDAELSEARDVETQVVTGPRLNQERGSWTSRQPNFNKPLHLDTYGEPAPKDLGESVDFVFSRGRLSHIVDRWSGQTHSAGNIPPDNLDNWVGTRLELSGRRLEDVDARFQDYLDAKEREGNG